MEKLVRVERVYDEMRFDGKDNPTERIIVEIKTYEIDDGDAILYEAVEICDPVEGSRVETSIGMQTFRKDIEYVVEDHLAKF